MYAFRVRSHSTAIFLLSFWTKWRENECSIKGMARYDTSSFENQMNFNPIKEAIT